MKRLFMKHPFMSCLVSYVTLVNVNDVGEP
ncbi:MAG: signal peptidase I [Halomonas sp. 54_146]|nr:MAG: signal peptidase I [Halomonas sp. 54_146]